MRFRSARVTWTILASALVFAILASLLPDTPYKRWQLLAGTIHARTLWMYERVHFDPAPIDILVIGPSRAGAAVSAPLFSQLLAERGLPSNVVNFSLPETGRDINAAIVEMALEKKRPKLIIIGVIEKPSRYGHSAFKFVAPREMVANPGYASNLNYLSNLAYLPFRQLRLFAAEVQPAAFGMTHTFDPMKYAGSALETTGDIRLPDGKVKVCTRPGDINEIRRGVRKLEGGMRPPVLGSRLADLEFGDERHFIRTIVRHGRARGINVAFVALPYYSGPSRVQERKFYERFGPLWNADMIKDRPELYCDYAHTDSAGAAIVTRFLAEKAVPLLAGPAARQ